MRGDPIKMIDWRAYARSDHLIIREKHEETNGKISIICDLKSSMNWPDNNIMQLSKKKIPRKSEVALRVALNLSYSHLKEGNQVYLVFLTSNNEYRHQLSSASEAAGIFLQKKLAIKL